MHARSLMTLSLLAAAAAACGDDGTHHLADGGQQPDASHIDGGPGIDAPLAPVTVSVTTNGSATAAVPVYFLNADSSVVSSTTTDGSGNASAIMVAGGSVTVLAPFVGKLRGKTPVPGLGAETQLDTFEGVKPGDHLLVDSGFRSDTGSQLTVHVVAPADPNIPDPIEYYVSTTCGSTSLAAGSGTDQIGDLVLAGCAVTDFLVYVEDSDGLYTDSIYLPNVAVSDDLTVTIPGPYVPFETDPFVATNLGSNAEEIYFNKEIDSSHGYLFSEQTSGTAGSGSGSGTLTFPTTTGTDQIVETDVYFDSTDGTTLDSQYSYDWGSATQSFAFDGSAHFLPHFTSYPSFDATTETVSWTQGSGGKTVDATTLDLEVQRTGSDTSTFWTWYVVAPGSSAGAIKLPTLPVDAFDYNAGPNDSVSVYDVSTYSVPGGYDVFRPYAVDEANFGGSLAERLVSLAFGTSGSIQVAEGESGPVSLRGHRSQHASRPRRHAHVHSRHK